MATAIIIQARVGSTRFPNKMTIPFYQEKGMLHYLLTRLKKAELPVRIILAIPDSLPNDNLQTIASDLDIPVFRGSEENVLFRFIRAAETHHVNNIIRVCADNPFLDTHSLKALIDAFAKTDADYIPFCLSDNTPTIKTHFGFWAEGVLLSTLKTIARNTNKKIYLEHVTNYIYTVQSGHALTPSFHIHPLYIDRTLEIQSWARFTVDTKNDFETMKTLATSLAPFPLSTPQQIINQVAADQAIRTSMQSEIDKNKK